MGIPGSKCLALVEDNVDESTGNISSKFFEKVCDRNTCMFFEDESYNYAINAEVRNRCLLVSLLSAIGLLLDSSRPRSYI